MVDILKIEEKKYCNNYTQFLDFLDKMYTESDLILGGGSRKWRVVPVVKMVLHATSTRFY